MVAKVSIAIIGSTVYNNSLLPLIQQSIVGLGDSIKQFDIIVKVVNYRDSDIYYHSAINGEVQTGGLKVAR